MANYNSFKISGGTVSKQFWVVVIVILALLSSQSYAQPSGNKPGQPVPVADAPAKVDHTEINASQPIGTQTELLLLREQNKLLKEFQESVLSTVLWSLGLVGTVAILVAGFGWWTNSKLYDGDRKRLLEDVSARLAEMEGKLNLNIESARIDIEQSTDEKSDLHFQRFSTELSDLRGVVHEAAKIQASMLEKMLTQKTEIEKVTSDTARRAYITEVTLREVEEHVWELKKLPINIFLTQCQGLSMATYVKDVSLAKNILLRMKATLEKSMGERPFWLPKATVESTLNQVRLSSALAPVEASEVTALVEAIRTEA
jgi:hypothetical protein